MPARIHEKKRREKEGTRKKKNVRIASTKRGIRDTLFISFSPPFLSFLFFFLRDCDDVVSEMLAFEERIGAVGREKEFAKGEGGKFL